MPSTALGLEKAGRLAVPTDHGGGVGGLGVQDGYAAFLQTLACISTFASYR